ncbi:MULTISPECIES: hypothetical protein [unclassified Nocardia]
MSSSHVHPNYVLRNSALIRSDYSSRRRSMFDTLVQILPLLAAFASGSAG